jgi:hypothetical protein
MRPTCRVALHNKVILRDELIEGDEKIREGGQQVAHHARDALCVYDFGITASRVLHDLRADNLTQYHRVSMIDHIIVPRFRDSLTLNLGRSRADCGRRWLARPADPFKRSPKRGAHEHH